MTQLTLSPAYGRDYRSKKDLLADFDAGKDFTMHSMFHRGRYASKRDLSPGDSVQFRYGKMRKTFIHTIKGE